MSHLTSFAVIFLVCPFIICLIIGLPTFFLGCNKEVTNYCPSYQILNGYIYKTKIEEYSCGGKTSSTVCYDVYVYASNNKNYNMSTVNCIYTSPNSYDSFTKANNKASNYYYYGKRVNWYKRLNTNECLTEPYIKTLWFVGITFLSMASFILISIISMIIIDSLFVVTSVTHNQQNLDRASYLIM